MRDTERDQVSVVLHNQGLASASANTSLFHTPLRTHLEAADEVFPLNTRRARKKGPRLVADLLDGFQDRVDRGGLRQTLGRNPRDQRLRVPWHTGVG